MMQEERELSPEEFREIVDRMEERILQCADGEPDESRAFDCKECGKHYVPSTTQMIFYKLCDDCFIKFDYEKMQERLQSLKERLEALRDRQQ